MWHFLFYHDEVTCILGHEVPTINMKLLIVAFLLFVTESDLCFGKKTIQKCCENGYHLYRRKTCAKLSDITLDLNEVVVYNKVLQKNGTLKDFFELKPGYFNDEHIKNESIVYSLYYSAYYLVEDGTVNMTIKGNESETKFDIRDPEHYCIDILKNAKNLTKFVIFSREKYMGNPLFYKCGFLISAIFLFLLLLVYALLPELRSLGGMVLMGYAGSCMFAYLFTFSLQILPGNPPLAGCLSLTYLIYFFLLSSFCWMNVMAYDIWWTFRGYAKARDVNRRGIQFKFFMYCLYAWGLPLSMTIMVAVLNEIDAERLPGIIKPEIPDKGCFLGDEAKLMYMYLPMLIMILANWMFFAMTVFNIYRLSRGTQILTCAAPAAAGTPAAHRRQRHRLCVYLKLSVVMGLSWLLEVVSSFYSSSKVWYVSDTYNVFIGLIIFAIFVCKKKVLRSLKKRLKSASNNTIFSSDSKSRSRSTRSTLDSNSQSVPLKPINTPIYKGSEITASELENSLLKPEA